MKTSSTIHTFVLLLISSIFISKVCAAEERGNALTIVSGDIDDENEDDGIVTTEDTNENVETLEENNHELFEATSEWKPVKKGQKIPAGLHVRLNLQTGEKEARLMDQSKEQGTNQWYAGEKMGTIHAEKQRFTREEIKKALKDFKLEDSSNTESKNLKDKFRSMDELKEIMKGMEMSTKTEAEIVTELLDQLKQPSLNSEDMKTVLTDLEYHLHQVDNARLFCDQGGMGVLMTVMNSTFEEIREKAALVLGSSLQNNAKVQIKALESGALPKLLQLISMDSSKVVKKRSLFALSTLLRKFPFAQKKFLELGGMSALTKLFSESKDEQMKVKVMTLLTNLVQEADEGVSKEDNKDSDIAERTRQYSEVQMREALQSSGWCGYLSKLLHQHSGHDNVDKVVSAMTVLQDACKAEISSIQRVLQTLSSQYAKLAKQDAEQGETDNFFDNIHSNIEKLLEGVRFKREDL